MTHKEIEGSGIGKLYDMMVPDTAETPLTFVQATIVSPPPSIVIRIDGESVDTPSEGIVVAEWLTEHKRTISFSNVVSGNVDGYHGPGELRNLQITKKEITIHCDLKVGDRVICSVANDGQLVYVLDKAVN